MTKEECDDLGYPAGTDWTRFPDDELERFVEYLYEQIGGCEVEIHAWGQVGGGGWWGDYCFAEARVSAIQAHRGAGWLNPIEARLRAYWDQRIEDSKRAMEAWRLGEDLATAIFPSNVEAREAVLTLMGQEWRRLNYTEDISEPR